jgi:hypothetical protein
VLRIHRVKVDSIYIPTERRKTLHPETARALAEDILENGMKMPIQVRFDGKRHIFLIRGAAPLGSCQVSRGDRDRRLPGPGAKALEPFSD